MVMPPPKPPKPKPKKNTRDPRVFRPAHTPAPPVRDATPYRPTMPRTGARPASPEETRILQQGDPRLAGVYQQEQLDMLGPGYQDPFNGANFLDLLMGMNGATPGSSGSSGSSGSGGSGSRGGGGGSAGSDPVALQAALDQMYGALDMQAGAEMGGFDAREQALRAMMAQSDQNMAAQEAQYSQIHGSQMAGFDQYGNRLADARLAGQGRLTGILGELGSRTADTRTAVSGAYTAADARLQALASEAAAAQAARNQGVGVTLNAFGVDPSRGAVADPAAELLMAQRANVAAQAGGADAGYANRGNVHAGLGADVQLADSQRYGSLQDKLAADRLAAQNQFALQQTQFTGTRAQGQLKYDQMMAELAAQRQEAAAAAAARRAQLALDYAPALAGLK